MPYKPLVPPKPLTEKQLAEQKAKLENDALWSAPYRPTGKLSFLKPKKDAYEMTDAELRNAWSNTARKRDEEG